MLVRIALTAGLLVSALSAQNAPMMGVPAMQKPAITKGVGIDQKLNSQIPLGLRFNDENGQSVPLGRYFTDKPVVLALVYYECPMLCDMVLNGLTYSMSQISLVPGRDFEVVTVSFNPTETPAMAAAKKATYLQKFNKPGAAEGWHFLTGTDDSIRALAGATGFRYNYSEQTKQYAHAAGIMVLTPEGKLSRYYFGVDFAPRDLRFGLIEASNHKIGTPVDQILLFCYHYDPVTGKYGMAIRNLLRVTGSLTVVAIGSLVFMLARGNKRTPGNPGALRAV